MAPNTAQARLGAHISWANTVDRAARSAHGQRGLMAKLEAQVDPEGRMTPQQRALALESARKAYFTELAIKSAAVRRGAGDRKRGAADDG